MAPRRYRAVAITVLAVVAIGGLMSGQLVRRSTQVQASFAPSQASDLQQIGKGYVGQPGVLLGGTEVSSQALSSVLADCGCLTFGEKSAPVSLGQVDRAFTNSAHQVSALYTSGLVLIQTPDVRSPDEYVKAVTPVVEEPDSLFRVIPFRGTMALVADPSDQRAAMSWVENGYLVQVLGGPKQSLDDLLSIAGTLKAA